MTGVLYVGTFFGSGGSGRNRSYAEDLADKLESAGIVVTRTSRHLGKAQRLADILYTAWKRRDAYDVAIVDVFSGLAFVWAEAVCFELRRLGKPYILSLHGGSLPVFARKWPRRTRALLRSAAVVTSPSEYLREGMRAYRGDVIVVPNAVDTSTYAFSVRSAPRPELVWIRAFHEIYNPMLAIDVVAQAAKRFPDVKLSMVGPDKDGSLAVAEARARELGVHDKITFVGGVPRDAVPTYLAAGDVFLNTTDVDNAPLSILEAAASGLCVVSTAVGGIPYLLEHERNALLVLPKDAAAMMAAIQRVLDEPGLAERLSRGARALAAAHDWTTIIPRWQSMLQEVAHA